MRPPIEEFIPHPDIRERHETIVQAPAATVMEAARTFDMRTAPLVRAIFWMRAKILRSRVAAEPIDARPFLEQMLSIGWGKLAEVEERYIVVGAATRPWVADVAFAPIPADQFRDYAEPERVKIAWTLEAERLGPETSRFATETRAVATDAVAREKFQRYWRIFGIGIVAIRWLLVPAIRRAAEERWRTTAPRGMLSR
ncbi:MAG TPA: hypothetical protein VEI06_08895 [Gemmatimonadaceae bacterium]|nr:hypothetical protein [Gemmatimonadaceae bacterium]